MPELDDVRIGETIAVEWGNAIRDRTIQRYADAAERDELHPNPTEGDLSYLEDTNSIEVFDGFQWVAGIPNGAVTTAKIAPEAVITSRIADEAVTAPKIGSGSITTDKIVNNAVTAAKIAPGAVITSRIADEAVTSVKLAPGAVITSRIADGQVTADKIADGAVTTAKVADGAVTAPKIGSGSVTTEKIVNQAVTAPKIADGAVITSRIADGQVTADKIAGNAISAFERSGATVATDVDVPSSVGNLATVTLNIPSDWSSWECVAFAQTTATPLSARATVRLRVRIDGTDGTEFENHIPESAGPQAAVAAAFRSGITTTGNRTIALRGFRTEGAARLQAVFLYARAFRTS